MDFIAAQGFGFGAGELVDVYLDAPRLLLGTTTANELGSFSGQRAISVAVPGGTSSSSSHFAYSFLPLESVYSLPSFAYMGAELHHRRGTRKSHRDCSLRKPLPRWLSESLGDGLGTEEPRPRR